MDNAIKKVISQSIQVKNNEKFLIVSELGKFKISDLFSKYAKMYGADVSLFLLPESLRPLTNVPYLLKPALKNVTY